jgi:hypothetical protein
MSWIFLVQSWNVLYTMKVENKVFVGWSMHPKVCFLWLPPLEAENSKSICRSCKVCPWRGQWLGHWQHRHSNHSLRWRGGFGAVDFHGATKFAALLEHVGWYPGGIHRVSCRKEDWKKPLVVDYIIFACSVRWCVMFWCTCHISV